MNQIRQYFNQPLLKLPLLFGLMLGILGFLYFLALYLIGVPPLGNHKSLDFGFHIILMAVAVWYYRRTVGQGYLHLWEGLTICYVVNSVGAFLTGWLIYFFITQVDPGVFTEYVTNSRNLLVQGKAELVKQLGNEQYQTLLRQINETQPGDLITDELVKKTALAVLPVLIISLLFRKQDYNVLR